MAAASMQEFFTRSKEDEATWPYKLDRHLSYVENRPRFGIKMATAHLPRPRRTAKYKGMGTTIVSGQGKIVVDSFSSRNLATALLTGIRPDRDPADERATTRCSRTTRRQPTCPRTSMQVPAQERQHARLGMRDTVHGGRARPTTSRRRTLHPLLENGLSGMVRGTPSCSICRGAGNLDAGRLRPRRRRQPSRHHNITVLSLQLPRELA